MFLEINEKSLLEKLSSNIINEEENMECLIKGVAESIMENLLKDKNFKKKLHKEIINELADSLYFVFAKELKDYAKQLFEEEFNKVQKEEKNKILKQILSKMEVDDEYL